MRVLRAALIALACGSASLAHAGPTEVATQLLDHLQHGRSDAAHAMFSSTMAEAVPADRLAVLWNSLGALQQRGQPSTREQQGMQMVQVPLQFASGAMVAQIAVDEREQVAGLMLRPAPPAAAPAVPADAGYSERDVQVPQARGALPGTLALPTGDGPFPAVVLVHGSGPQDRNETIGGNHPFLDIARGLAARGIAVLRYDKRSMARPQDFSRGDFSVDDETTDDAVAALAALAANPRVDSRRVFVLGHSQGGMLAPRIAMRWPQVRGAILWAAPARSLLDLLPEQNRYLLGLDGTLGTDERAFLQALDQQIAAARGSAPMPASALPLGVPQTFWQSIEAVDARADARALDKPLLLLHGGRDFQVTAQDWSLWQQALGHRDNVRFKEYAALNHLGIAGNGRPDLQEYATPGQVDTALIEDVAAWLAEQR